ncbi:MAG: DNA-3-methyladenine glycosylase I [Nitriliruptoraceae bacterium]
MNVIIGDDGHSRCAWVGTDEQLIDYHDNEWGHIAREETRLFEKVCLEGFQAGLSWRTVLHKRDRFRHVYDGFDPQIIATYTNDDIDARASDPKLIRQRAKHAAVVTNARSYLKLHDAGGTLNQIVFASHDKTRPRPVNLNDVAASTLASVQLAKTLKKHGFVFVGPVTMYALMQACGVVNDHVMACTTSV